MNHSRFGTNSINLTAAINFVDVEVRLEIGEGERESASAHTCVSADVLNCAVDFTTTLSLSPTDESGSYRA